MTREEEIQKAKEIFYASSDDYTFYNKSFEEGAKWADKTMIDKVCKWVDDIDFDMEYWNCEDGFCKEMFINALKKAMEE